MSRLTAAALALAVLIQPLAAGAKPGTGKPDKPTAGAAGGEARPVAPLQFDGPMRRQVIRGEALYEDVLPGVGGLDEDQSVERAIRRARVEVLGPSGIPLASGWTRDDGSFRLPVRAPADMPLTVAVRAERAAEGVDVRVWRPDQSVWTVSEPVQGGQPVRLLAAADPEKGRVGAAFNIFDQYIATTDYWREEAGVTEYEPLIYRYGARADTSFFHKEVLPEIGEIGTITLLADVASDDDGYDDSVILHETAHYLDHHVGSTCALGGNHDSDEPFDPGVALNEGLATFMGLLVQGDATYIDTFGPSRATHYDLESVMSGKHRPQTGIEGELAVAAAFWDLLDDHAHDDDPFDLAPADWWSVFAGIEDGEYKSAHTYLDALVERGLVEEEALHATFAPIGLGRPERGGTAFPPHMITASEVIRDEVDATRGWGLSGGASAAARRIYGLELEAGQSAQLRLRIDDHAAGDLDLVVQDTEREDIALSDGRGPSEQVSISGPGRYVVVVRAWEGRTTRAGFELDIKVD